VDVVIEVSSSGHLSVLAMPGMDVPFLDSLIEPTFGMERMERGSDD
jgi:hypothetical protein